MAVGSQPRPGDGLAGTLAAAGLDIIKDDHSLGDQAWSPWRERVARCSEAVAEANAATGGRAVYMPSMNVPAPEMQERAHLAKSLGAGALLALPGISGFDAMRALADDDELALPRLILTPDQFQVGSLHRLIRALNALPQASDLDGRGSRREA